MSLKAVRGKPKLCPDIALRVRAPGSFVGRLSLLGNHTMQGWRAWERPAHCYSLLQEALVALCHQQGMCDHRRLLVGWGAAPVQVSFGPGALACSERPGARLTC